MTSLFWSMLKNINSAHLNRDMVGFTIERFLEPIGHKDVVAYARATRDKNPAYQDNGALAPPFYLSKLIFPMIISICVHKNLHLNLLRMVHGEQEIIWHQPVKVGQRLKVKLTIESIRATSAGEFMTLVGRGFSEDALVVKSIVGLLVRRKSKEAHKKSKVTKPIKEIFRLDIQTDEGQQLEYARASGDNNFIHTNHFLARLAGLPRTIMHGLCVMAMACAALTERTIDNDIHRLGSIKGRFAKPTLPGEKLVLIGYEGAEPSEIHFDVFDLEGKPILQNGVFKYGVSTTNRD